MQSVHQALTRSITTPTRLALDRPAVAAALDAAGALAARLLTEISLRWPVQASGWAEDSALCAAFSRALAEQSPMPTWPCLARALGQLTPRPYPPEPGALIAAATEPVVSAPEARRALLVALAAVGRGEWHTIPDTSWQAGCAVGWDRLRQMPAAEMEGAR